MEVKILEEIQPGGKRDRSQRAPPPRFADGSSGSFSSVMKQDRDEIAKAGNRILARVRKRRIRPVGITVPFRVEELQGASVAYSVGDGETMQGEFLVQATCAGRIHLIILGPLHQRRGIRKVRICREGLPITPQDAHRVQRAAPGCAGETLFTCLGILNAAGTH